MRKSNKVQSKIESQSVRCILCDWELGGDSGTIIFKDSFVHATCSQPAQGSALDLALDKLLAFPQSKEGREALYDLCRAKKVAFTFQAPLRKFYDRTSLVARLAPAIAGEQATESTTETKQEEENVQNVQQQPVDAVVVKADKKVATLGVIEDRVAEIAREVALAVAAKAVANVVRVEHYIKTETGEIRKIKGSVHYQFGRLLKMCAARRNVWLAGPAGSGKTTAAAQVADALSLPFHFNGAIETKYDVTGFVDAQGKIVDTAFRKAYANGGVYLFDEVDASLPGALLAFNAALSNGHADFPGCPEPVKKHPNFVCLAAGNTWGLGATADYVGRAKLDAAFRNRFVKLAWNYDEVLETELALAAADPANDSQVAFAREWVKKVQALRAAARKRGLKVVISPRASLDGVHLYGQAMTVDEILDATVRADLTEQDWANLSADARLAA